MITSEQINELVTALAIAHLEIDSVPMNGFNPHFKSKYATLADLYSATNLPLSRNGLTVCQSSTAENGKVTITTRLFHKSGQWIESKLTMKATNDLPQSIGSTITYGRRYEMSSILGVCGDEDDDGEAAQGSHPIKENTKIVMSPTIDTQKKNIFSAKDPLRVDAFKKHLKENYFNDISTESYSLLIDELDGKDYSILPSLLIKYKGK